MEEEEMTLLVLLLPFARAYLCELLGLVCVPFCLVLSAGACSFRFGFGLAAVSVYGSETPFPQRQPSGLACSTNLIFCTPQYCQLSENGNTTGVSPRVSTAAGANPHGLHATWEQRHPDFLHPLS